MLDEESMIYMYCSDDLHRDDLTTIVLHHLLVTTLHFPLKKASRLIAEWSNHSLRLVCNIPGKFRVVCGDTSSAVLAHRCPMAEPMNLIRKQVHL